MGDRHGTSSIDASPRLRHLFGAYSSDPVQGKLELFPANRSLRFDEAPGARRPTPDPAEGRLRMTSAPEKYAGLRAQLRDLVLADAGRLSQLLDTQGIALRVRQPDALAPYREAIASILPSIRLRMRLIISNRSLEEDPPLTKTLPRPAERVTAQKERRLQRSSKVHEFRLESA